MLAPPVPSHGPACRIHILDVPALLGRSLVLRHKRLLLGEFEFLAQPAERGDRVRQGTATASRNDGMAAHFLSSALSALICSACCA